MDEENSEIPRDIALDGEHLCARSGDRHVAGDVGQYASQINRVRAGRGEQRRSKRDRFSASISVGGVDRLAQRATVANSNRRTLPVTRICERVNFKGREVIDSKVYGGGVC